ncbi:DNA-directed RNA polymerase specialized sigma24 family protein [Bradyrhizobium sp. LM2.7]
MNSNDDRRKFAVVVAPYLADAHAFARWLMHDRADAEDVVQEACIRAFRAFAAVLGTECTRLAADDSEEYRFHLA